MSNSTANTKLRISNLSPQTTDDGLGAAFMQYGTVQEAVIKRDRDSGKSRGFGFVSFPSEQESKAAFLVHVTSANKVADGLTAGSFYAYTIKVGAENEVKRRYSEFESLRNVLCKIYPTLIIPPIPEKHSLSNYANIQKKNKEDAIIVEKRIRRNDALSPYLDPSQKSSKRNSFGEFVLDIAFTFGLYAANLTNHVAITRIKHCWAGSEIRRQREIARDYSELGANLNGFSLSENQCAPLSRAIERTGQTVDSSFMATTTLFQSLAVGVNEPLQEYIQYANIIKSILKFRHQKHIQSESTADQLESKRNSLDYLEKQEIEASKIDDALKRGRQATTDSISTVGSVATSTAQDDAPSTHHRQFTDGAFTQDPESEEGDESHNQSTNGMGDSTNPYAQPPTTQANPYAQTHTTSSNAPKRKSTRFNNVFNFSSISHTIHGIIDVDPEATRRSNIGRTREAIAQLEDQLETTNADLDKISRAVQGDLDRFQRQKIKDLKEILLAYARAHQAWCKKNKEEWAFAKEEVEKIPK
ncbi:Sorting nexin, cytoplasm-to-vacuole targeting pathway/endosomal sorting [Mortierella sp. NVP85]|nr:Sorting nexin, cytoplasm-to-vacuole targeting pathway/endosomal sorting [Mortierella sp. NVP85]